MAKKPHIPRSRPTISKPPTKRKQFFPQLATHQEQMLQQNNQLTKKLRKTIKQQSDDQSQVELDVLKHQNANIDSICEVVQRLISKNKVSAKNAFQVPLIDLQQLPHFKDSMQDQHTWKILSATLQSDYKIYGFRVDAIHGIAYNMLHSMMRRQQDMDQIKEEQKKVQVREEVVIKINSDQPQAQNLESNVKNIDATAVTLSMGVDSILQRNKRQLDQLGTTAMLMDTLNIDLQLGLQLVHQNTKPNQFPQWGQYYHQWSLSDPLLAFVQLSTFRQSLQTQMTPQQDFFQAYQQQSQKIQYQHHTNNFNTRKPIHEQIRLRNAEMMKRQNDIMEEGRDWYQFIERKMFNKKVGGKNQVKSQNRYCNPEDFIDFVGEQESRQGVLRKENDKMQVQTQIQQQFLIAPRLFQSFQTQLLDLTLKPNPVLPQLPPMQLQTQVDIRRQMVSILQAKRRMKGLIHSRSTFQSVYQGFNQQGSQKVSPALCFLTVLHLANQNHLKLEQMDQYNFYIR